MENWGKSKRELVDNQLNHYLYKRAEDLHSNTKLEQLTKAAEKYPEPLEPDSWTAEQCGKHAFQELIDLEHYVTMQLIKNERLEAEVKRLNNLLAARDKQLEARVKQVEGLHDQLKEFEAAALTAIRKAYYYGR